MPRAYICEGGLNAVTLKFTKCSKGYFFYCNEK